MFLCGFLSLSLSRSLPVPSRLFRCFLLILRLFIFMIEFFLTVRLCVYLPFGCGVIVSFHLYIFFFFLLSLVFLCCSFASSFNFLRITLAFFSSSLFGILNSCCVPNVSQMPLSSTFVSCQLCCGRCLSPLFIWKCVNFNWRLSKF